MPKALDRVLGAEITDQGAMVFEGKLYASLSSFALHIIRTVNPARLAANGWDEVRCAGHAAAHVPARIWAWAVVHGKGVLPGSQSAPAWQQTAGTSCLSAAGWDGAQARSSLLASWTGVGLPARALAQAWKQGAAATC